MNGYKKTRNATFKRIGSVNPRRSSHNLSYSHMFTCDMGQLIPVCLYDCIPGDHFILANQMILRFQPLVKPTIHEMNTYVHYFFVPYRLLDDNFEDFITMGVTGDYEGNLISWSTTPYTPQKYTLWDYFGWGGIGQSIPVVDLPNAFPKQAYNFIYNEYYRDQNYITPVDLMQNNILNCAWEKDYFTAAQPEQQRGTSPSFEINGIAPVNLYTNTPMNRSGQINAGDLVGTINKNFSVSNPIIANTGATPTDQGYVGVDTSSAHLFNINDLRLSMQIQLWMERNQRGGVRYTEFLRSHFGISPRDERLDRPEYIGGTKSPIIISEVLQTSNNQNDVSPQGNLAGHGISVSGNMAGRYTVKEFGLIMGLMSVRPRTAYSQGIERNWLKKTPFDYVFPEFVHLSEQGIMEKELYISSNTNQNNQIFGFIPRYDEYRYKRNLISADMRDLFSDWHLARGFANNPQLNSDFITMNASKRIFAVQNEPGLVVNFGNSVTAIRPIPVMGEPGLIDHTFGG